MSLYFNETLNTKLKELTDQLSNFQNSKKNDNIKNLDSNYQSELIREQENKRKEMIKKKKKKNLKIKR